MNYYTLYTRRRCLARGGGRLERRTPPAAVDDDQVRSVINSFRGVMDA